MQRRHDAPDVLHEVVREVDGVDFLLICWFDVLAGFLITKHNNEPRLTLSFDRWPTMCARDVSQMRLCEKSITAILGQLRSSACEMSTKVLLLLLLLFSCVSC